MAPGEGSDNGDVPWEPETPGGDTDLGPSTEELAQGSLDLSLEAWGVLSEEELLELRPDPVV
jgi:hypothetical protein